MNIFRILGNALVFFLSSKQRQIIRKQKQIRIFFNFINISLTVIFLTFILIQNKKWSIGKTAKKGAIACPSKYSFTELYNVSIFALITFTKAPRSTFSGKFLQITYFASGATSAKGVPTGL